VVHFGKEASQARDFWVAKNATLRAARSDPSLRKERLLQDDNQTAPLPRILGILRHALRPSQPFFAFFAVSFCAFLCFHF